MAAGDIATQISVFVDREHRRVTHGAGLDAQLGEAREQIIFGGGGVGHQRPS